MHSRRSTEPRCSGRWSSRGQQLEREVIVFLGLCGCTASTPPSSITVIATSALSARIPLLQLCNVLAAHTSTGYPRKPTEGIRWCMRVFCRRYLHPTQLCAAHSSNSDSGLTPGMGLGSMAPDEAEAPRCRWLPFQLRVVRSPCFHRFVSRTERVKRHMPCV